MQLAACSLTARHGPRGTVTDRIGTVHEAREVDGGARRREKKVALRRFCSLILVLRCYARAPPTLPRSLPSADALPTHAHARGRTCTRFSRSRWTPQPCRTFLALVLQYAALTVPLYRSHYRTRPTPHQSFDLVFLAALGTVVPVVRAVDRVVRGPCAGGAAPPARPASAHRYKSTH